MKRNITIKDVAHHSGFGIGTVSRAINSSEGVSQATREKILKSIETLGYKPDHIAQSMRSQKYKNVAFFADISNPVFAQIAKGAQLELEQLGYTLSLCNVGDKDVGDKILSFLEVRKFDGVILSTPREDDWKINKALSEIELPIVTINRDVPVLPPGITTDYYSSVKKAINYLLRLGHRGIVLIGGDKGIRPTREGIRAYHDAFSENNLIIDEELIKSGVFTSESGKEIFLDLCPYIKNKKITAILSLNNQMFYGILQGMKEKNLNYPEDVSLITFEDSELLQLLSPPVTVIRRPIQEMGTKIAKVLMKYIQEPELYGKLDPDTIPTEFIIRDSCKAI
ncbi:LacI family DNA-binding transcriptional regulator [Lentibacillus amyloliquefaciens]|uniref:HTH lacI-type domain-containing protein n=1 Tax=Lentibacillus amyloliquefaciens TaxID=1472767 RepID=A0A0U4EW45_9BACI|nr:substrate-binding domain-containing protein [Lentibacillus amyloliquefaciens]ALX47575.1 hypothetical protein AOX59_02520 [Lentibacillus amyloliquefaciens]